MSGQVQHYQPHRLPLFIMEPIGAPLTERAAPSSRVPGHADVLTRREREVAELVAMGYTDRELAEALTITEGTAGLHVHHILEKLGFRSRVQIGDWALAHGIIGKRPV